MQRIGSYVAVFFHAYRGPITKSNFAEVTAAGSADAATLLLSAIDPVGKLVVGNDVIKLRRRLVVPGTPGLSAVHADGRSLVDRDGDNVWVFGIDPDGVVVVATGRALDGGKILAAIGRFIRGSVGHVNHVLISWIDADAAEVVASSPDTFFVIHLLPALAGVVGTVNTAAFLGVDPRVHAVGIAGRNGGTQAAGAFGRAGQGPRECLR